jgi:hypothetical protein
MPPAATFRRVACGPRFALDRILLVIGSAVIAGCFFAGQSIGYRGVFLLLVLPGLLALSRTAHRKLRILGRGAAVVILLLMWGECFRLALYRFLEQLGASAAITGSLQMEFWLLRELCWWWTISVMLAVVIDFLREAPIFRSISFLFDRSTGSLPRRSSL